MRPIPVGVAALACWWVLAGVAQAQALDDEEFDAGARIYRDVAKCEYCHGWHGLHGELFDRVDGDVLEPGPSLVASTLDRDAMIEVVACGVPGSRMPRYLPGAWTADRPCYGKTADDLERAEVPPRVDVLLSQGQIETVVTFVQTIYQGRGMTVAECRRYYFPDFPWCERLR